MQSLRFHTLRWSLVLLKVFFCLLIHIKSAENNACSSMFIPVSTASWDSLCWTFTPENYTENFTMVLTPQTARLDRSGSSATTRKAVEVGCAVSCEALMVWFDSLPQEETGGEVASSPPESSFQKLAPSETRYTILSRDRDELWPQQPSSDPVTQCHAPG